MKLVRKFYYHGYLVCIYKLSDKEEYGYKIFKDNEEDALTEDFLEMFDVGACEENAIQDIKYLEKEVANYE